MINNLSRKINSILAITLVLMMAFALSYSEYYVCREAFHQHECHHDDCLICTVINQSNNLISSILLNEFAGLIVTINQIALGFIRSDYYLYLNSSLVTNNVRLNE